MANIYKNIEGDTATEIVLDSNYVYNNMLLCNTHASDSVDVDLYITRTETTGTTSVLVYDHGGEKIYETQVNRKLQPGKKSTDDSRSIDGSYDDITKTTYTYYIIKNVTIPEGVSLMLNEEEIKYDMSKYRLYIQLSAATCTVDLKISKGEKIIRPSSTTVRSSGGY